MREAKTQEIFSAWIRSGEPCFSVVDLNDLHNSLEALMYLTYERPPDDWTGLRAVCPVCSSWVSGNTLSGFIGTWLYRERIGKEQFIFTNYGDISHLLEGRCINSNCTSRVIQLVWKGDQSVKEQLMAHLQRIQTDNGLREVCGAEANDSLLKVVAGMQENEIRSFVQDVIFSAELNHSNQLTTVGLSASANILDPNKYPKIAIWVSILPLLDKVVTPAFLYGYKSYLNRLLNSAKFDEGDITVAHWIRFGNAANRKVNLSLLSEQKSLGTSREFCILPAEIP